MYITQKTRNLNRKHRRLEATATRLLNKAKRKRKKVRKNRRAAILKERPKYSTYMKSGRWRKRRLAYYEKYGKKCVICGATNVNLHHISYARLGKEEDEDLVLLCEEHHEQLHEVVPVKNDMREETYQFIIEQQELEEFKRANILNY